MSTRPPARRRITAAAVTALALLGICGCGTGTQAAAGGAPIRIGAVFPLSGPLAAGGMQEEAGVETARDLVNAAGGVNGHPIELVTTDLHDTADAQRAVDGLVHAGAGVIVGAYSSDLSDAASAAAARDGAVYWEAGAEADRLTARGLPRVFRVGATGGNLGSNSIAFAAEQLAPRLGVAPSSLRVSVVVAGDGYAHSVADAAVAQVHARGLRLVSESVYDPYTPDFTRAIADIRAAQPDILVLASHIPDGIAFRRAFLAAGLRVRAFIGSTMAQCMPDFGDALGADAVGVFASDRPGYGFDEAALPAPARSVFDRFAAAWRSRQHSDPGEEPLSGFTAGWALFAEVLPRAGATPTPDSVTAAAMALRLPEGSLPNGAGLEFAGAGDRLGQNLLAAAVVWQWQAVRHEVVVWPGQFAAGRIDLTLSPSSSAAASPAPAGSGGGWGGG